MSKPTRQSITIATAGHVDHGKTSLVRCLTGTDTDTLADEKARGLSINLGFAYRHLADRAVGTTRDLSIGFVDVPGHTDFINNALAGIGSADFALLVIAADDGVMPQTREHLAILNLLGVQGGAIAITKMDRVSDQRLAQVDQTIARLVADSVFADTPVFPLSTLTGAGIDVLKAHLDALAVAATTQPVENFRLPRFAVDRAFSVKGIGTVVTGTVIAGVLDSSSSLVHSGSGQPVRIRELRHDRQTVTSAIHGERVAININIPHHSLSRGDWLLDAELFHPANRIDARLQLLEPAAFNPGIRYHLYHGTAHYLVTIRRLGDESCPYYQVFCSEPVLAHFGDRFILRDPACKRTVGGGMVVDSFVPRRGRNSATRLEYLAAMDQEDDLVALQSLLTTQPGGVPAAHFARCRNCQSSHLQQLEQQLTDAGLPFVQLDVSTTRLPLLLHDKYLALASQSILDSMAGFHRDNPSLTGAPQSRLQQLVDSDRTPQLFAAIVEMLVQQGRLLRTGTLLRLPDHQASLSGEEQQFLDRLRPLLLKAGLVPPRTRELVELTGMKLGTIERILAAARKAGLVIQVAGNRHYLPETMLALAQFTESLATDKPDGFTVIEFRDRLEIGRNLCIEVLEYFDRAGFTVRMENHRQLRENRDKFYLALGGSAP